MQNNQKTETAEKTYPTFKREEEPEVESHGPIRSYFVI